MKIINQIRRLFAGKKTYIIAVLLVVLGVLRKDPTLVLEGLGILFLRVGIKGLSPVDTPVQ